MTRPPSLRTRITIACVVAISVALCAMAGVAYLVVDHQLYRSLDLELSRQATVTQRLPPDQAHAAAGPCEYLAAPPCVQTVTADGTVTATEPRLPVTPQVREVAAGRAGVYYDDITVEGNPARLYVAPLRPGTAIEVALRTGTIEASLARIGIALGIAAAVGILIATGVGVLTARAGLRPLATLTSAAERVADTTDPGYRITVTGRDEIARLGTAFNTMLAALGTALDSLHRSLRSQRRLVADASHQLRTPLTALRTNIDLLAKPGRLTPADQERVIAALGAQARDLTTLVGDLTDLARGDDPGAPTEEVRTLRLDRLVEDCVRTARRDWPHTTFGTDLSPTTLTGRPRGLTRAIGNILDNAAKYGHGMVHIGLHDRELSVRDDGPGIPAEALPHVFDRFYRAPDAHHLPGSGIGLAMVEQVAEQHGATVTAETPAEGGTVIRLRFSGT